MSPKPAHDGPMRRGLGRHRIAVALGLAGLLLVAQGLWIPAKAALAQVLIARAWQAHLEAPEGPAPPPWPWADTVPIARLELGHGEAPLYVLSGASGEAMAFGPAHVSATAAPGSHDHVAIAGHRDTHFAGLRALAPGDRLRLESTHGGTDYEVVRAQIVHERRVDLLEKRGHSELSLVTCYPFDAITPGGPLRYIVQARALADDPRGGEAGARGDANQTR